MTMAGARSIPGAPGLEAEYEVLRELGRGGTAVVYLARERTTGHEVAVKVILATYAGDQEVLARFAREASVVEQLQHPGIVPIHGIRQLHDGCVALVMARIPGRTLKETIRRTGPLPPHRVEEILRDIAEALGYAHSRGIVHRDVKPENIFIDETTGHALLSDFGIARPIQGDTALTLTGVAIGTPTYMSPEQIDRPDIDGRSDLYSLGLVGWEMLSGTRPWDGESLYGIIVRQKQDALPPLDALRPDVPDRLLAAIEGLLERDRDARCASAEAFLAQLSGERPAPRRPRPHGGSAPAAPSETIQYRRPLPTRDAIEMLVRSQHPPVRRRLHVAILAGTLAAVVAVGALLSTRDARSVSARLALATESGAAEPEVPSPSTAMRTGNAADATAGQDSASGLGPKLAAPPDADRVPDAVDGTRALQPRASTGARPGGDHPATMAIDPPPVSQGTRSAGRTTPTRPDTRRTAMRTARGAVGPPHAASNANSDSAGAPPPAARASVIAGGVDTCLLTTAGAAYCWGGNDQGQLGTGTTARAARPVAVAGALHFVSISPGLSHTCAIARSGVSYCWGANGHGQLGTGSRTPSTTPVRVAGHWRFTTVQTGIAHSCALGGAGQIYCWGDGSSGQLGNGRTADADTPIPVAGNARFTTLAVGWHHSCALDQTGTAYCWGQNAAGQLGDGTTTNRDTPTPVHGGPHFVAIAAGGAHSCGLTAAGEAYCWGRNRYGQLGDGDTTSHPTPARVVGEHRFRAITTGGVHSCALTRRGTAECWGRNSDGQLGDGTTTDRTSPVAVAGDDVFTTIHTTGAHTCATTIAGASVCWGYNVEGQLGDGTRTHRAMPVHIDVPHG